MTGDWAASAADRRVSLDLAGVEYGEYEEYPEYGVSQYHQVGIETSTDQYRSCAGTKVNDL